MVPFTLFTRATASYVLLFTIAHSWLEASMKIAPISAAPPPYTSPVGLTNSFMSICILLIVSSKLRPYMVHDESKAIPVIKRS